MERLKQAMDRARAERQLRTGAPSPSSAPQADSRPAQPTERNRGKGIRINYTRTETMSADLQALRDRRIILAEGLEPVADAYKVLRTQVLQRMRSKGLRTLAITSPSPGDGKTITAINLAISLARDVNQTVLLVDLDMKRPAIAKYFGRDKGPGISDCLTSNAELADIMFTPDIERLVVIPGHERIVQSSEALASPRFISLLAELKTRYDDRLIIFDMPPLFSGDDVIAFLPQIDAAILVVENGKITKSELEQAEQLLGDKAIGAVLNKADAASVSYGYY
ncbi:CpsD/CapB family tyrosine-protein kinase [Thiorhodococcus minor]|uniref:non-specific protein-tyrosine kinase n=1 Tax=Thiorhodococcus minor TaxID=57489 RepID=A0A6M0K3L7_9GAMM|nr:CpsD/CapB family tyrosine-protein kinase [Thiorhodococcus minor]NEV63831.1 CpsD/CapB family tyrosine-protein kinase [Thiorhodococcus minor]